MKLYDNRKIDFTKEPMFFGDGKNTQRFDVMKYKFFDTNNDNQQARFWKPQEIKLSKDKANFTVAAEHKKWIYTKTLQRLIFLDSLQGRSPFATFGLLTTLPELENDILTWTFFEGSIHSKSYSWNLRNVYTNPSEVFDETFKIPLLMEQAEKISGPYNDLFFWVVDYLYKHQNNIELTDEYMKSIKKHLVRALINVNILEGIRFYAGFASVWAMTEGEGIFSGSSRILRLICRDENQHLALTQKIISILKKTKSEGFVEIFEEMEDEIVQMYHDALEEEFEWTDLLYLKGSVIGLNDVMVKDYLKYLANQRTRAIGIKGVYATHTKNPLPWIEPWVTESSTEGAPQEDEVTDYVQGAIDLEEVDYSKYKNMFNF
jgi:ribonucleoside-diphosphate reductase beta chain